MAKEGDSDKYDLEKFLEHTHEEMTKDDPTPLPESEQVDPNDYKTRYYKMRALLERALCY